MSGGYFEGVHRAVSHEGAELACKLQYADMQSAVEADLRQLGLLFAIRRRFDPAIDTTEMIKEIGAQLSLSVKTISTYHSNILEKLEVRNDAELGEYALRHNLIA